MDVDGLIESLEETVGLMLVKHLSPVYVNEAITALRELKRERDEARAECIEQARLLGMGAAREARLIAERDEARMQELTNTGLAGLTKPNGATCRW